MCGAMFALPLLDCFAKLLGEGEISSGQIVLFRFSFQTIILLPILFWRNQAITNIQAFLASINKSNSYGDRYLLFFYCRTLYAACR